VPEHEPKLKTEEIILKIIATAISIIWLIGGIGHAWAAEKEAPKPTCGKTLEECQKAVDDLTGKLGQMTLAYQGARQQRMEAKAAPDDAALQTYVTQQSAQKQK
jgi:hypothetical protein